MNFNKNEPITAENVDRTLSIIRQNTETLIGEEELRKRLLAGKRLRIKLGVDPTRPDLTFGHLVVFSKLRQFQDLGHQIVLIIGDYTTRIGDPTGRSATRPELTLEEIKDNASTYLDQVFRVLDQQNTEIHYNSEWFEKMGFHDALLLARKTTVARMLERDDFSKRFAEHSPISLVEFLYPLLQGYDSVVLQSDVEIGGNDQLFNMLMGRQLQKEAGLPEQAVLCMPLLVGLDGVLKMSKSYGNYIAFNDSARDMFGKLMSIPDEPMFEYYRLLLAKTTEEIAELKKRHPMEVKKELAVALTARFHGEDVAKEERQRFETVFSKQEIPEDMPQFVWQEINKDAKESLPLLEILAATGLFPSKSEARRLVQQGAVKINGEKVADPNLPLTCPEQPIVIQAGKRTFFRLQA
jgi:tyrosyl-tRNA synthetase